MPQIHSNTATELLDWSYSNLNMAQELLSDLPNAQHIADYRYQTFKSLVLKSKRFPIIRHYECKTVQKKNRFFVNLTALKRGNHKAPYCHYYCIYSRPEGLYCAVVGLKEDFVYIYPPHFFARYRERIIKQDDISPEDLIHLFMSRFWSNFSYMANQEELDDINQWEQLSDEDGLDFIGTCPDGVIFGQRIKNVVLNKTIISESMLYPDQVDFYERVYLDNYGFLKETYPEDVLLHIIGLGNTNTCRKRKQGVGIHKGFGPATREIFYSNIAQSLVHSIKVRPHKTKINGGTLRHAKRGGSNKSHQREKSFHIFDF